MNLESHTEDSNRWLQYIKTFFLWQLYITLKYSFPYTLVMR